MSSSAHHTEDPGAAAYFAELAERLRVAGLPEQQVAATVADLAGYLAESGSSDAHEEFGAPDVFAARLTRGGADAEEQPAAEAETWKWAADVYADRKYLNRYGDQGWEVQSLDRLGRFVCRREPGTALRWEYRREIGDSAAARASIAAELAPDGWESCGRWLYFLYFKRPRAASAGPAADLDELVAAPERRLFLGGTYRGKLRQFAAAALLSGVVSGLLVYFQGSRITVPFLVGAAVAAPVGLLLGWYRLKREATAGLEDA
ncbi:hypothetical protein GCM10009665_19060 [Kitasatospora nipponensis]|uniref:DUF2812 domain-containing protein n=1 Tax=Kitasatospora nipponensis TaxID=258049 RepID=A0ABP4GN73_9ACTN